MNSNKMDHHQDMQYNKNEHFQSMIEKMKDKAVPNFVQVALNYNVMRIFGKAECQGETDACDHTNSKCRYNGLPIYLDISNNQTFNPYHFSLYPEQKFNGIIRPKPGD